MIIILSIKGENFSTNKISWETYSQYFKTHTRQITAKVELLRRQDEVVCASITGDILNEGGNLTVIKQNGCRRSVEFTLVNVKNEYTPKCDSKIWIRERVQIYFGFIINDVKYWIPQGIFVLDNPIAVSEISKKTVSIRALDKFSLLDGTLGGELSNNLVFPAGSNVYQIVKTILNLAGDPAPFLFDNINTNIVTTYAIEKTMGDKLGDILLELADMLACNVFYDGFGMLRFQPDANKRYNASMYDFGTNNDTNYFGASQEFKFSDVFNSVLVIGDNSNGNVCSYKAINNNIRSDLSVNALGFERCKVITDTNISTTDQAKARAEYELKKLITLQSSLKLTCGPMYHLDIDDVISLTDKSLDLNQERFIIQGIQIPFGIGNMTIDAAKIIELEDL